MAEGNIPLVARIMVQHGGGPGGGASASGSRDSKRQEDTLKNIEKNSKQSNRSSFKSGIKLAGILGLFAVGIGFIIKLFKSSQVTKGIFKALFDILGALVDVILAPFVPLIVPLLQKLASQIPVVADWAQGIYDGIVGVVGPKITRFLEIWDKEGWRAAMKYAWEAIKTPLADAISALWESAVEKIPILGTIGNIILETARLISYLFPPIRKLAEFLGLVDKNEHVPDTLKTPIEKTRAFNAVRDNFERLDQRELDRINKYGYGTWQHQVGGGIDTIMNAIATAPILALDAIIQGGSLNKYQLATGSNEGGFIRKIVIENRTLDELNLFEKTTSQKDIDNLNQQLRLDNARSEN